MKYNQPYGISDPNAPYINGNPTTGTMGSIPPAESIEHPQREITRVITETVGLPDFADVICEAPTSSKLDQLLHAIEALIRRALPKALTAPRTYYVDVLLGSDTNDGTAAAVSGGHGPFKTIAKALTVATSINLNGYTVTIQLATGTYPETLNAPIINGSGTIQIVGNTTTPSNCVIQSPQNSAFAGANVGTYALYGVTIGVTSATAGDPGAAIVSGGVSRVYLSRVVLKACPNRHLFAAGGGAIILNDQIVVSGGCAGSHMEASGAGSQILVFGPTLSITIPITVAAWANANSLGMIGPGTPPNAPYISITGAGNVTGTKYAASLNGVLSTNSQGAAYYPGTVAGSVSTGGQYL